MKIPKALSKWSSKISDIYLDGDQWNVGLKPGWICNLSETHQVFEGDLQAAVAAFRNGSVIPCKCAECVELMRAKA